MTNTIKTYSERHTIRAIQFDGYQQTAVKVRYLLEGSGVSCSWAGRGNDFHDVTVTLRLAGLDGHLELVHVPEGHWIVRTNFGEVRLLSDDVFTALYEEILDA